MKLPSSLISVQDFGPPSSIVALFTRGIDLMNAGVANIKKTLTGCLHMNVFFEPSTRTSLSFESAAKRLGAEVVNFSATTSSLVKGETQLDTLRVLDAMEPDSMAVRTNEVDLLPRFIQSSKVHKSKVIVNAGDGTNEHPTQALLDAFVLWQHFGHLEGLKVVICGDILHSRVTHSNAKLLQLMGAHVVFVGPEILLPKAQDVPSISVTTSLEEGCQDADVIMALRFQHERMESGVKKQVATYAKHYCIGYNTLQHAKPGAIVMHPGPINRDVEIESQLADDPHRCKMLDQVRAGVYVRMAILEKALQRA